MQRSDEKPMYFMPRWFGQLFVGRFSFGDTFYAGMFGSGLIFVPAGFIIAGLIKVVAPEMMDVVILWMTVFYAVYISALAPAVVKTGLATKSAGGWRWFGIFLVLVATGALWWAVYKFAVAL